MAKCSKTSFSWEKLFIRVLHLVLTTFVITVLILKDTELRKSLILQQWFYVLPYFAIVTASTVFYFVAGSVDPGFVASNDTDVIMVAYEKTKEDNTEGEPLISENCEVFGEPSFHSLPKLRRCGYCNLMQPLRSKHCEDCNRCVYRYDHHCPWLGNCVGERNHRYFWAFLLFETILIAWSIEIGWFGFQRKTLWSDWIYFNGILLLVMFILVIAVIVVTLLFGCHSYLIIIGRTTWEHMAHSKISYLKIFKEGENPFHEGYIKNVCKFMCHFRIRKWESIFHRSSMNLGV